MRYFEKQALTGNLVDKVLSHAIGERVFRNRRMVDAAKGNPILEALAKKDAKKSVRQINVVRNGLANKRLAEDYIGGSNPYSNLSTWATSSLKKGRGME